MPSSPRSLPAILLSLGLLSGGLGACSSPSDSGARTGGTTGSGGAVGSGGSVGSGGTSSAGGRSGTGGSLGSGGASSAGGRSGTGGASANGGSTATGGSIGSGGVHASGGAAASGGSSTATGGNSSRGDASPGGSGGGAGMGGAAGGLGGRDGSAGGAAGGGSTGSGTGGSGAGGSTASQTSPGCGSASPLKTSNSLTESIDGTTRKWMLDVPTNYDASKPYRLIFVWHPLGGSGSQVVGNGFNGLKALSNGTTVFATADGLNGSNGEASGPGWWNANGGDMKLLQAMLDKINAGLCIDQQKIFSTGFSFGGMMSYTVPFEFDVFRAIAPCSGDMQVITHKDTYTGPVPIMAFHGNGDTVVSLARGKAARDKYLTRNKCGTQTQKVDPSPCVQYDGCAVPTIWCEFSGGHDQWSGETKAIWNFFSQF